VSVATLPGASDIHPDAVLEMAKQNGYQSIVVVGINDRGELFVQSSSMECSLIFWWLSRAARFILRQTRHLDSAE